MNEEILGWRTEELIDDYRRQLNRLMGEDKANIVTVGFDGDKFTIVPNLDFTVWGDVLVRGEKIVLTRGQLISLIDTMSRVNGFPTRTTWQVGNVINAEQTEPRMVIAAGEALTPSDGRVTQVILTYTLGRHGVEYAIHTSLDGILFYGDYIPSIEEAAKHFTSRCDKEKRRALNIA